MTWSLWSAASEGWLVSRLSLVPASWGRWCGGWDGQSAPGKRIAGTVLRGIKVISTCRRGEVGRCVVSGALSIRICWSLLLLGATGASTSSSLGLNWDGLDWEGLDSGLLGLLGLLLERIESRGVLSTICWREAGAGLLFSRPTDSLGVSRFWEGPRGIAFWFRCTFLVKLRESH